jgi:hypothetical protein
MIFLIHNYKDKSMNDTTDITTLSIRVAVFIVIAGIFYVVLKSKKSDK